MDGRPFTTLAGGGAAPSCVISGIAAGDQRFAPGVENPRREALFRFLRIDPRRVYGLYQTHSHDVFVPGGTNTDISAAAAAVADAAGPLPSPTLFAREGAVPSPTLFAREGDGMVSFSPGIFLSVTVADCLPVFLLDTRRGFFAALHSGWKGTGIVLRALDIMEAAGTAPEDIAAVLGPCIQSCCYRVDEERALSFKAAFGAEAVEWRDGGVFLDLQAANIRLLSDRGAAHIAYCRNCTFTDERLGSFRREGADNSTGPAGKGYTRMAALAGVFDQSLPP